MITIANQVGNIQKAQWSADLATGDRFNHRLHSVNDGRQHRVIIRDLNRNIVAETSREGETMGFGEIYGFVKKVFS